MLYGNTVFHSCWSGEEMLKLYGSRDRIATRSSLEWHPARLFLPSVL